MIFTEIYIIFLILATVIGGLVNLYQLINFIKQSKSRFLSSRNPPLIIMYCVISLSTAFTTTPLDLYYQGLSSFHAHNPPPFFAKFAVEFFHEFCTSMLLIIIICRSWLLYYDYKFSETSSDEIWRNIVNDSGANFWKKNRKTLGNLHFIICLALIVISVALLILSFIGSFVLKTENSDIFHMFSLFGLGIPFYLFIVYLIMYKIQLIHDVYLIHKEIKYLSICIVVRIIAFSIDMIIYEYDDWLLFLTIEVLTTFLSVWIQCWWVLNKLKQQERERDMDLYTVMKNENDKDKKKKIALKMNDVFDQQMSFEIFIRHCTHELSVESILFLIEIAQFKATLNQYNAYGIGELKDRFIDVNHTNFIKYIKKARQDKIDSKLIIHPAPIDENSEDDIENYELPKTDSLPHGLPHTNTLIPPLSPSIASPSLASPSLASHPSATNSDIQEDNNTPQTPPPQSPQSDSPDADSPKYSPNPPVYNQLKTHVINLKQLDQPSDCVVASTRGEYEYKLFQETVLQKKWLPIAKPLLAVKASRKESKSPTDGDKSSTNGDKSKTKTGTGTGTGTGTQSGSATRTRTGTGTLSNKTKSSKTPFTASYKLNHKSQLSKNAFITPISLAVIEDSTFRQPGTDEKQSNSNHNKKQSNSNHKNVTVDINWIYEFGRHLYLKYVDNSADLAINISHNTRKHLWSVYSKELNEEAFQTIQLIHHNDLSTIKYLTNKEEQLFIQTYLYHAFDLAFHSIWHLLKSDTFYRFQRTRQYKDLCGALDDKKLQEARKKRDTEYSKSYQETHLDV